MPSTLTLTSRFTALIITFVLSGNVYCQRADLGIKSGATFSSLTSFESASRASYTIGVLGGVNISKLIRIESGLNFLRKGAFRVGASVGSGNPLYTINYPEYKLRYNYLQLPLLVVIGNQNFSIHSGFYLSKLTKAEFYSESRSIDLKEDVSQWDNGFIIGFRFYFKNNLFFELNRTWGFTDLNIPDDSKNKSFHLLVGYYLTKGRYKKKIENRRLLE